MFRVFPYLVLLFLLLGSCRKDVLHWQRVAQLETHTTTDRFYKIFFVDDSLGFVIGGQRFYNSTILTTENGGRSWNYRNIPEAPKALFGITRSPAGVLYIAGFDGKLLRSADSGKNWQFHQLWYLPYKDLAMLTEDRGLVIGGISFYSGCSNFISSNGSFTPWDSVGYELNDIEMINSRTGFISGHGVVLRTEDSGYSWQLQEIANDNFKAIHAYGDNEAWTCGYNGSIFHTSDGGRNWERIRNGNDITLPRYRLLDILFTDGLHGYAVGEEGLFIYTDDGGHHWMEFDRFTSAALNCVVSRPDGSLMVCGENGSLFRLFPREFP